MRSTQLAPGQKVVDIDEQFEIVGPIPGNWLERITVRQHGNNDGLILGTNAGGTPGNPLRIGRIEIDSWTNDGVKVLNGSVNAAHDIVIEGGYVRHHAYVEGAHQDSFQVMGGARITVRNVLMEAAGTQAIFINKAGGKVTLPTDIVFESCKAGCASPTGGPATPVNINESLRSGVVNCTIYQTPRWGKDVTIGPLAQQPVNVGNVIKPLGSPGCAGEPVPPGFGFDQEFFVSDAQGNRASILVPIKLGG